MNLNDFLNFTLDGFWHFVGVLMLLGGIGRWVYSLYTRLLRHFSIMKHGYPPEHCDGDGEFKRSETKREDK